MKKLYAALIVFFFVFASTAFAAPFNSRPLGQGDATLEAPHDEQTLGGAGGIFDDIGWTAGANDPFGTQSNAAIFTNMATGSAVASFIIAIAGNAPNNEVGLYQYGNTGILAPIFSGTTTDPTQALVSFLANGDVMVSGFGEGIVDDTYVNFGNKFGFYISGPGGTFFTLDSDNPGGLPQALVYQGDGSIITVPVPGFQPDEFGSNHWIFAFEDVPYDQSDKDFNDFVFIVESIVPVPEPGTLLLLGLGLIGLAGVARRKN